MKVVKNREELRNLHDELNNEKVYESLDFDVDILEEYPSQSDEYGPLIILIDETEQKAMGDKYPLIKELEPEDYIKIYEDDNILIERTCYILTDSGYIVYINRKKA